MPTPEHISKPIRRIMAVLEVAYEGDDYDQAIEAELKRLGIREDQVKTIIAIPPCMTGRRDSQAKLFE